MKVDFTQIAQRYKELSNKYEKLGLNISQALELLLKENDISYLSINYRVKESTSFIGKIERKNYQNPLDEIEDICGVRVICYYQSDVEKIKEIIKAEFDIIENKNKVETLEFNQFGYRSMHFILKIKQQWLNTPNYRGLENLKTELQIRTVLMHAWAEIEHKLAYKSESQIPKNFRRKLSRISAKLEESDEQFEEIKNQIEHNKNFLIESAKESQTFLNGTEFNLDTLHAFLDYAFPGRTKDIKITRSLFDEMKDRNVDLKDLSTGYEKTKHLLRDIENEIIALIFEDVLNKNDELWAQVGGARMVLDLTSENYKKYDLEHSGFEIVQKYRKLVN